jgi:hypothetical protein
MAKIFFDQSKVDAEKVIISENLEECCICLEDIKSGSYLTTCCKQNIHKECLKKWCKKAIENKELATCPLCMQLIDAKHLFTISLITKLKTLCFDCCDGRIKS